ncbi:MAG TPA: EF-hand domain-containing protein [Sphingomicrobium sp.]|nr:EF-hand domain-containing protein [Sphingomicrobium sp.]
MKALLLSAAAVAAIAVSPAIGQSAPAEHPKMTMEPMTRDALVQKVQAHFAKIDADKDGFVTKAEMEAARGSMRERMKQRMGQRMEQHGPEMFDRMDANKDGSVSRAEFDAAHQSMAGHMAQPGGKRIRMMSGAGMAGHMFATADADNDGRVSLAEATAAAAAHFDKADANRDGSLTPEEMRSGHRLMKGHHGRR